MKRAEKLREYEEYKQFIEELDREIDDWRASVGLQ